LLLLRSGLALLALAPAELQETILLEQYRDWAGYEARRAPTIASAYHNLQLYRAQTGAGVLRGSRVGVTA